MTVRGSRQASWRIVSTTNSKRKLRKIPHRSFIESETRNLRHPSVGDNIYRDRLKKTGRADFHLTTITLKRLNYSFNVRATLKLTRARDGRTL